MSTDRTTHDFAITRVDYERGHGWMVRLFYPGVRKPAAQRLFSDGTHGHSADRALCAARAWRDVQMTLLGISPNRRDGNGYNRISKANTSGRVGVKLGRVDASDGTIRNVSWVASVMGDGRQKNRCWSIRKYGYVGAWRLATAARGRHDGLPSPEQPPPMPTWVVAWLQKH